MNGDITVENARLVLRTAIGMNVTDATGAISSDIDSDGVITVIDAGFVLRQAI